MCHLLTDPSIEVQKLAYRLLSVAAKKRTEHFVIEAGVDTEESFKGHIPLELLDILQQSLNNQLELLQQEEVRCFPA
jgi:hypothetical protein